MNGESVIIYLYVDDLLIFVTCDDIVNGNKSFLASNFDMKVIGQASVTFGNKITRNGDSIILSQNHYVEEVSVL